MRGVTSREGGHQGISELSRAAFLQRCLEDLLNLVQLLGKFMFGQGDRDAPSAAPK
jgi:hypothetical protein